MMRKAIFLLIGLAAIFGAAAIISSHSKPAQPSAPKSIITPEFLPFADGELIAHAGGAIEDLTYSNSLEALNLSVRNGFKYIEIDFLNTKNGDIILLHDWKDGYMSLFSAAPGAEKNAAPRRKKPTKTAAEFKSLVMTRGLTQMDLNDLITWMSNNPEVYIVTDIKADNLKNLRKIRDVSGEVQRRFIPQIHKLKNYSKVKALGYEKIILTTYRNKLPADKLGEFCRDNELFALTMPSARIQSDTFDRLGHIDTPVFVHTINSPEIASGFIAKGVSGVYTDFLYPDREASR